MRVMAAILALGNENRGHDSWGVVTLKEEKPKIIKAVGAITKGIRFSVEKDLSLQTLWHTRHATAGAVTKENAHPFEIGNIMGAHNGVISNFTWLNKTYPDRKFEVDSQHLIAHIDENKDLSELSGWGSVEYVDKREPNLVKLGRGSGGELAVAGVGLTKKEQVGVVWSSDDRHLIQALTMAGFPYYCYNVERGKFYTAEKGILYTGKDFTLDARKSYSHCYSTPQGGGYTYGGGCGVRGNGGAVWDNWEEELEKEASKTEKKVIKSPECLCENCDAWCKVLDRVVEHPPIKGTKRHRKLKDDKLIFYSAVSKWLCGKCASTWDEIMSKGEDSTTVSKSGKPLALPGPTP